MRNNLLGILVLALPFTLQPCLAASGETIADQLTRIDAETLVLKAQERQLAIQTKVLQLQSELTARQASIDQSARPGSPGDPTVQSIEGIGDTVFATLLFENGSSIDVRAGDILPNGMRVLSVRTNEVTVSAETRRKVRLLPGNGNATLISAASGAVPTTMTMPASPPSSSVPRLPIPVRKP
ncbi:type IV pilus biogenesis protein PilP [Actimicrobium sp. CCI2.3]|uniref:type IV pilus biogenesis protein PilP n=1 Tax=Actimicrobium sp. CCI2.3 TaxID=3048616 RepID=UPI002AB599CC|nr:type IV pilus biogenesis protein PilP [Actimicrobium sp. CCI2.3]MDY7573517.1 type IV pilus biogenesis protein PilP [Actimicrobium sp. CCI2.3]MEB0022698.1 type IV pilus biogenesis protein PilP [Actimicrobium sp. CCI2.3]